MHSSTYDVIKVSILIVAIFYWIIKKVNRSSDQKRQAILEDKINHLNAQDNEKSFEKETEEEYVERCMQAVAPVLMLIKPPYSRTASHESYMLEGTDYDDYLNSISINPVMQEDRGVSSKAIIIQSDVLSKVIPDHKLAAAAELASRLNQVMLFSALAVDYGNRALTFRCTLMVGDQEVDTGHVIRHLKMMTDAVSLIPYFERVIFENEEPALVALDYHYSDSQN